MLMNIYVRYIHNDIINPFENCGLEIVFDSVTHKVLISDTKLGPFILPQVFKMNPKFRQVCRCEICIIPKDT